MILGHFTGHPAPAESSRTAWIDINQKRRTLIFINSLKYDDIPCYPNALPVVCTILKDVCEMPYPCMLGQGMHKPSRQFLGLFQPPSLSP